FKHHYAGDLIILRAEHLPELRCTPDHGIYATTDPARPLEKVEASQLTRQHFLGVPREFAVGLAALAPLVAGASRQARFGRDKPKPIVTPDFYLVPVSEVGIAPHTGDVYNLEVEGEHNYL